MSEKNVSEVAISQYFRIIQNVISKMTHNSFLIKAWSGTVFAGVIVLTISIANPLIFMVLLVVVTIFWYLDSYYLRLERLFRSLYNMKVEQYNNELEKQEMKIFDMDISLFIKKVKTIPRIMFSKSEALFYIPLNAILLVFLIWYTVTNSFFL